MSELFSEKITRAPGEAPEPLHPWYVIVVLACLLVATFLLILPFVFGLSAPLETLSSQLGGAVLAAAAVSFVYDYYLRRHFMRVVEAQTRAIGRELLPITKKLRSVGLVNIHLNRSSIHWYDLIFNARRDVAILGTSLGFWANLPNIGKAFGNAIHNGAGVRLLALDPRSPYADERGQAISIYPDPGEFFGRDIEGSVAALQNVNPAITAYYYSELPTCVVVILDERVIVNFVLRDLRGREAIHFEFQRGSERAQEFEHHFNAVWDRAEAQSQPDHAAEH